MSTNFYSGFVPEKPTSKVMAPPGGKSNNIFGFYEEEKKPVNGKANGTHATNGSNNDATSNGNTNGTSSNGTPTVTTSPAKQDLTPQQSAAANKHNNIHGTNIFGYNDHESNRATKPRDNTQSKLFGDQAPSTTNDTTVRNKKRTGYNPITGRPYEEEDEEREKEKLKHQQQQQQQQQQQPTNGTPADQQPQPAGHNIHTSSRVLQPPGGRTTKLW